MDEPGQVEDALVFGVFSAEYASAFVASFSVILVSELGDKTFFIAAIMAMRNSRLTIFNGAISALGLMTVLSCLLGRALPALLPKQYTHYAATLLFFVFGLKLLKEAIGMDGTIPNEELEEVEQELGSKKDDDANSAEKGMAGSKGTPKPKSFASRIGVSPAFIQAFTLTFLAEWGDRSQIATIALAAAKDPIGVTVGGTLGHAICTGVAVMGGRLVASRISEKLVTLVGGTLFLIFAVVALYEGPDE